MEPSPPTIERPAFRHLDIRRVEHDGQAGVVLHDPLGIAPEQVFVPEGLLPVVSMFDGQRQIAAIEAEITRTTGQTLPPGFVADLARQLDERLVLQTPRFRAALEETMAGFLAQTVRPARHAGSAGYPANPEAAAEALGSMVKQPPSHDALRPTPRGLIAPHIDLARGREGYVMAYSYLAECEPADLYVVFGTGHQGPSAPVTGLAMDWHTAVGTMPTDHDFVAAVHTDLGQPDKLDLFLHRDEHALEFQMLLLAHVLTPHLENGHGHIRVAGFLCGQLPWSGDGQSVLQENYVVGLLDVFRKHTRDRKVCFIAGADLAHVGPFFGDPSNVDQQRLETLAEVEREKLSHLERGDPGAFHRAVEQAGNPDRICGTTPITLVTSLAGGEAELLHYGQAAAPDGSQAVSFCSMVMA